MDEPQKQTALLDGERDSKQSAILENDRGFESPGLTNVIKTSKYDKMFSFYYENQKQFKYFWQAVKYLTKK